MNLDAPRTSAACCQESAKKSCACCEDKTQTKASIRSSPFLSLLGWGLPGLTLALMPKCPACVAAYIAAATGLGISLSTASYFRSTALVVCAVTLLAMSLVLLSRVRHLRRA